MGVNAYTTPNIGYKIPRPASLSFQGEPAALPGTGVVTGEPLLPKKARIELFYQALERLPRASHPMQAYHQITTDLKEVEDTWSNQPYDPIRRFEQERMYPLIAPDEPLREVPGYPGVACLPSKGHDTFLSRNGAIEIQQKEKQGPRPFSARPGRICFRKAGADGYFVWDDALSHPNPIRALLARFLSGGWFRKKADS